MIEQSPEPNNHEMMPSQSKLYGDLRELHQALSLEMAQETAAFAAVGTLPNISRFLAQGKESLGSIGAGTKSHAHSRLEHRLLTEAAEKQGVAVSYGDELPADDGEHLVWKVAEDVGGISFRYRDSARKLLGQAQEDEVRLREPFASLSEKLKSGELAAVTDDYFALDDANRDLVIAFMRLDPREQNEHKAKAGFMENLYQLPVRLNGEMQSPAESLSGVYFNEEGQLVKILRELHAGVAVGMYFDEGTTVDPSDTTFRLGIEIEPTRASMEQSYNGEILSPPFVETTTGRAFVDALEANDIQPSSELVELLAGVSHPEGKYDRRYGNRYSELTRTVAKYVGSSHRSLELLFDGEQEEARVRLLELDVDAIDNQPVRLALKILQQSVDPARDVKASNIPVHEGVIKIRSNSCKDAEKYFLDSISEGAVSYHQTDGGEMLHKHQGGKTAINLSPVMYKGVEIPAGGLFQRHVNIETGKEEYAFVRLTSFAFDRDSAADAFGWHYTESSIGGEEASLETLSKIKPAQAKAA